MERQTERKRKKATQRQTEREKETMSKKGFARKIEREKGIFREKLRKRE